MQRINLTAVGTYGADYLSRAGIAYAGPRRQHDRRRRLSDRVHRCKRQAVQQRKPLHPAFPTKTKSHRCARLLVAQQCTTKSNSSRPIRLTAMPFGDRDKLSFNPDGSLDLYIQRDTPTQDKEAKLATGSEERSVHDEYAFCIGRSPRFSGRKLDAIAGSEAGAITDGTESALGQ